jgi:N-terminal domain of galactosyltransferase
MLSIIITCDRNRDALEALLANIAKWQRLSYEAVVVGFDLSPSTYLDLERLCTRLVRVEDRPFNKSFGINIGVAASRMQNLFLLDADVIVEGRTLAAGQRALDYGHFATVRRVQERDQVDQICQRESHIQLRFENKTIDVRAAKTFSDGGRTAPGLIFLRRNWFINVGGMNSSLKGWGWEDIDLIFRLQAKLGLRRKELGSAIHLSHHESNARLKIDRLQSEASNIQLCLENYRRRDFTGTYRADAFRIAEHNATTLRRKIIDLVG